MSFKVGDVVVEQITVTDEMVRLFAKASGDMNPMHLDEEYAKKTKFGQRIAHGLLTGALISRTLAMKLGPGGIYLAQTLKFLRPVYIGDTIEIKLKVTKLDEETGIGTVSTNVFSLNRGVVVKGEATIMRGDKIITDSEPK